MFDIGFWELIIIGVVALLVVGPERFPSMVKKAGQYVGQFRRIAASVKSEISIEVDKAEQLQELLEEQKQILKRNAKIDLTQPAVAVKKKTAVENKPAPDKVTSDEPISNAAVSDKPVSNEPASNKPKPKFHDEMASSHPNTPAEEKSQS